MSPQTIQRIERAEAPVTVAMVIEFSDLYWEFLWQTLQASYGFVSSLQPEDWVAVVVYDLKTDILQDFTRNKNAAFAVLNRMRYPAFRETNLFDALTETIDRMEDIEGKKAIVLISSGVDTFSKTRYNQALDAAKGSSTPVYAIGTGQAVRMWYDSRGYMSSSTNIGFLQADNQLRSFARLSGGRAYFPRFEGQFGEIYADISAALRNEYQITYSPTTRERRQVPQDRGRNRRADGKDLKIVDPKGKEIKYEVRYREGYYASRAVRIGTLRAFSDSIRTRLFPGCALHEQTPSPPVVAISRGVGMAVDQPSRGNGAVFLRAGERPSDGTVPRLSPYPYRKAVRIETWARPSWFPADAPTNPRPDSNKVSAREPAPTCRPSALPPRWTW